MRFEAGLRSDGRWIVRAPSAPLPRRPPLTGARGKLFSRERTLARDANSLPTEGREEVRVAGAAAQRGIRAAVERAPARATARCAQQGADPSQAKATCGIRFVFPGPISTSAGG